MDIKAICFDIDGTMYPIWMTRLFLVPTIFPSIPLMQSTQKFRHAIREENGEKTDPENQEGYRERQAHFVKNELQSNLSVEIIKEKIASQFYDKMKSTFSHIRPFVHLRETIISLKENNISIGALSDFPIDNKLEALRVADLVDHCACTEESGYLKPHKAPFEYVEQVMGVPLKSILYVGDSYRKDIIGAHRVGMKTCLLLPHSHGKNKREKYSHKFPLADFICSDYLDMNRQLQEIFK